MAMTNPTAPQPQLSESEVEAMEQKRYAAVRAWHSGEYVNWFLSVGIPALIRDWRAMKAQVEKQDAIISAYENQDEEALAEAENL